MHHLDSLNASFVLSTNSNTELLQRLDSLFIGSLVALADRFLKLFVFLPGCCFFSCLSPAFSPSWCFSPLFLYDSTLRDNIAQLHHLELWRKPILILPSLLSSVF